MADERPDWFPGALAAQDAYQGDFPDRAPVRITVRPQMEVAPPKSFEDYLGEAMTPREADTLQRPPVFGLTNRYVDPNDPTTQAGAQRLSNYYGLPGRLLTGDPRNTIQPEVPGQWSDRDEARAALQAGNMTLGGMGMGVDATTGAMPRGFAGTANTLGVGGGRPPRIGDVANPVLGEVAALDKPALSGEVLPPVPLAGGRQLAGVSAEQRAKLGPMVAQLEKLGATPEQMASFTPQEAYDFIKARNMPQPIRRTVDYRDPSGRPTQTAPLPIGTEQAILGRGYDVATGARPPGPQPPLMQAAERKGPIMGEVADLTTPSGIRAYHGSPHDFERFDINKIGTGEGAQSYGHGLYFAEHEPVAREYRDVLTRRGINDAPISPTVTGNALFDIAEKSGDLINGKIPFGPTRQLLTREQIVSGFEQGKFSPHELTPAVQRKIIDQIKPPGHMYEVNINARPEQFLNWDAPLSRQAPEVQGALSGFGFKARPEEMRSFDDALLAALQDKGPMTLPRQPADPAGEKIYSDLINQSGMTASRARASQAERSSMLREAGIPGIKYLDQGSRFAVDPKLISDVQRRIAYANEIGASPEAMQKLATELAGYQAKLAAQTSNYVLFDDKLIDILRKYGIAGMLGGGAAAMGSTARQDQYAQ